LISLFLFPCGVVPCSFPGLAASNSGILRGVERPKGARYLAKLSRGCHVCREDAKVSIYICMESIEIPYTITK